MFGIKLIHKNYSRKFSFTPFYYEKQSVEEKEDPNQSRITFKRIRSRATTATQSLKLKLIFAILLILFLYYFKGLVEIEKQNFRIEDIKIEEIPSNY